MAFVPPKPGAVAAAAAPVIPNPEDAYSNMRPRSQSRTPGVRYEGLPPQPPYDSGTYYTHPAHTPYPPQAMYPYPSPANYLPPQLAYAGVSPGPSTLDVDGYSRDWAGPRQAVPDLSQFPPQARPRAASFNRPRYRAEANVAGGYSEDYQGPISEYPDFGQAPPALAPAPAPRQTRHGRAASASGLSPDWTGPTQLGGPPPPIVPIPHGYEDLAADYGMAYSPYHAPPPHPNAYYSRSGHSTPWRGGGYLPVTPVTESATLPHNFERAARPDQNLGVDTRWMEGSDYGPVLDPVDAAVLKVNFKINPLLSPPPEGDAKRPYLDWCMLFQSNYVRRSDEDAHVSWMKGRGAPATFPRLASLRIVSRRFTWFVDVKPSNPKKGVTCGDVIDRLSGFFYESVGQREYKAAPPAEQNKISESYHRNRSRVDGVPGGRLGPGLRRCDFLSVDTMYGGIEVDMDYVRERMRVGGAKPKRDMVNIFVLKCERDLPRTLDESNAEAARGRI